MAHGWYVAFVLVAPFAVYLISRYVVPPERHAWAIWIPTALAIAIAIGGLATADWWVAGLFSAVVPISIWRALPSW